MKKLLLLLCSLTTASAQLIISPSGGGGGGSGDALTTNPLSQFAATTSLQLKNTISDETGSGLLVFATSPTFTTPILGTPTSGTLTNCTGLPVAGLSNTGTGVGTFLITPSSANLLAALTDETGTGGAVFATSPTITTPLVNTISSVAGTDVIAQSTIPIVAGTSTAGTNATLKGSDAIAGNVTAGAAVGGNVTITAGDAKRLTSGAAIGGAITIQSGAGVGGGASGGITFSIGSFGLRWKIEGGNGNFLAVTDNVADIGASGATRPRTIYAGTSVVSPTFLPAAGTATVAPFTLTAGTNKTTPAAGDEEFDGTNFYATANTTNSRMVEDGWNFFRLTGSGTGITTIADFFGATGSGIPLVSGGVYEIEWHCYFSQATAGTATWTITTATTALANLTAEYVGSPIGGIGTVGTPQTAAVNVTTSSATAMPVTGTEATAATHYFVIHAICTAGAGASNTRLRLTMSAGTATPLINSYFKVRQLPAANVGTFAN